MTVHCHRTKSTPQIDIVQEQTTHLYNEVDKNV